MTTVATAQFVFDSRDVGSKGGATRVRIVSTPEQPTSFAGITGVVVDSRDHGNVRVRFFHRGRELTLPFGASSLEVLS